MKVFVSLALLDTFTETSGQFPAMFVVINPGIFSQNMIFSKP